MKVRVLVPAAAVAAALVAVSIAVASGPSASNVRTTVVRVSMYEMDFKLSKRVVRPGWVVFKVVNSGKLEHDFRLNGKGTPMLGAGERATLKVRFPKRGTFTFLCTVEGHAGAGMIGKLIVR